MYLNGLDYNKKEGGTYTSTFQVPEDLKVFLFDKVYSWGWINDSLGILL